jgi:signal peptidase I
VIYPAREVMPLIEEALLRGQRVRLTATGGSMWPFLRHNDVIELAPVSGEPRVGDILLARLDADTYVVHRLYRRTGGEILLLGDGTTDTDDPLPLDAVVGEVVFVQRGRHWRTVHRGWWRLLGLCWMAMLPCRESLMRALAFCARRLQALGSNMRAVCSWVL